jgi:flagellar protein FlaI
MFKLKLQNIFSKRKNRLKTTYQTINVEKGGYTDSILILKEYIKPIVCNAEFKRLVTEYDVKGLINVKIGVLPNNELFYCVTEPQLSTAHAEDAIAYLSTILEALSVEGYDGLPSDMESLKNLASRYKVDLDFLREHYIELSYYVRKGLSGYGPLYPLIEDPNVEEIAVDGPGRQAAIVHRLLPLGWINTNIVVSEEALDSIVLELAYRTGREVSLARPYLESLLKEGHRVSATFSREISRFGSTLVVRKHRLEPFTLPQLVRGKMLSPLLAAYLWLLVLYRAAILIIGPTASGKTTLLQALLHLVPPYARIVTIEDTPELNLAFHPHWDSLVARRAYERDEEDIDVYKLAIFALRRRPDYFVVGEVRGAEARVFIHAAASGHAALTTFHADSVETAIYRLKAPPINLDDSFLQLLWAIVVVRRVVKDGIELRRVVYVDEVVPEPHGFKLHTVFAWDPRQDRHTPASVDDLIANSIRLKMFMDTYGLQFSELKSELNSLAEIIASCLGCSQPEFIKKINTFYKSRLNNTLKIILNNSNVSKDISNL